VCGDVANLYEELDKSYKVLNKIDNVVDSFQLKLSNISEEVSKLQQDSEQHNISLKNRRALEESMHEYLECILLPEELIDELCNKDIEEDPKLFLQNLERFNHMLMKGKAS
jgi:predicted translin family RNA/ssDNA-binding protein